MVIENANAVVKHIEQQLSDNSMLILYTNPDIERKKRRFCFDKRWLSMTGVEEVIRKAWYSECIGSSMFQVTQKIKRCRLELLKWNNNQECNSTVRIQKLKEEMSEMKKTGGQRDWDKWNSLKGQLDKAYKDEEMFWSQKARVQWLKERDHNTSFFHASVVQRRKCNRIEQLDKEREGSCNTKEDITDEISGFYEDLFTSEDSLVGSLSWKELALLILTI